MTAKKECKAYPHSLGFRHGWFYDPCWLVNIRVISPKRGKILTEDQASAYIYQQSGLVWEKRATGWNAACIEVQERTGPKYWLLIAVSDLSSPRLQSIIAHECVHAANYICQHKGYRLDMTNDEAYAYLVGSLVERVNQCLR